MEHIEIDNLGYNQGRKPTGSGIAIASTLNKYQIHSLLEPPPCN